MLLARVKEPVVSTAKVANLNGRKLLLVEIVTCGERGLQGTGRHLVCLDATGAGSGELVLAVQGSSALKVEQMRDTLTDGAIVGIVDSMQAAGRSLEWPAED